MNSLTTGRLTEAIKARASMLGFDLCGIASSRVLIEYEDRVREWCDSGMNDKMSYLGRDIGRRIDPETHLPGTKSIVVTGLNYYTEKKQVARDVPVISRYAFGKDYHVMITRRLNQLLEFIKELEPAADGRAFCDSAPFLEKPWAAEAGLGWQGKHSVVINDKIGSFFFIGILVLNLSLDYDKPLEQEKCGSCRACIDSCPTKAINNNRTIDARRCIANLTIENRGPLPAELIPQMEKRIYGCDKCQEVCPWNRQITPHRNPELDISEELANLKKEEWLTMTEEKFKSLFSGTPVERVGFDRFRRNVDSLLVAGG